MTKPKAIVIYRHTIDGVEIGRAEVVGAYAHFYGTLPLLTKLELLRRNDIMAKDESLEALREHHLRLRRQVVEMMGSQDPVIKEALLRLTMATYLDKREDSQREIASVGAMLVKCGNDKKRGLLVAVGRRKVIKVKDSIDSLLDEAE